MSIPISPISLPASPIAAALPVTSASAASGASFQSVLQNAVNNVENSSAQADAAVSNYLSGGNQEIHSMVLATQNADLNFEMFMQVRNKVVSAYEEIMRMQV
jgi:flagellar hook-basal body complex protein FliE